MKFEFDLEKFMRFRLNSYAWIAQTGGCVKCAVVTAMGYTPVERIVSTKRVVMTPEGDTVVESARRDPKEVAYPWPLRDSGENFFSRTVSYEFARLIDEAESRLRLLIARRTGDTFGGVTGLLYTTEATPDEAAKIKNFVIQGMRKLGLLEGTVDDTTGQDLPMWSDDGETQPELRRVCQICGRATCIGARSGVAARAEYARYLMDRGDARRYSGFVDMSESSVSRRVEPEQRSTARIALGDVLESQGFIYQRPGLYAGIATPRRVAPVGARRGLVD